MAERAIARAKELDEYHKRTGKLIGPLVRLSAAAADYG